MTKLEELEQNLVDARAASEAADKVAAYATYVPAYLSDDEAYALIYAPIDDAYAANANYVRAKKKLVTYLKEQANV